MQAAFAGLNQNKPFYLRRLHLQEARIGQSEKMREISEFGPHFRNFSMK